MDDDAALMQRVAKGETDAFRLIVERYEKPIYNFFVRSTGNREDAEDLAQQLFLNLYDSASRYEPRSSFKTFIYRIASNLAVSFSRKQKLRRSLSLEQLSETGFEPVSGRPGADPAREFERKELEGRYREALLRLPAEWRTAIELRVGRELSYGEIADAMGKSLSAVESILFRARERLAREMNRPGSRAGGKDGG
jgi:RNA polymerase sigma-70 factor (ECF subfamily)